MSLFSYIKKYWPHSVLLAFVISYFWVIREKKSEIKLLESEGVITKARIFKKVNKLRSSDSYKYEFYVSNMKYTGDLLTSSIYYVDDTIEIIYYPRDPSINNISTPYKNK
ncbi:MAG: hypothetical protein IT271_13115 [Chitinophagales bacterium]|nr:hypothetical protein [Chitinophagales bacterium]